MAAATEKNHNTEEIGFTAKLNDLIQKNRKILFIGLAAVIVILLGFIVGISVRNKIQTEAIGRIDEFERRYSELRFEDDGSAEMESKRADLAAFVEELTEFQNKTSGFAKARAYSLAGDIHADQKRWAEAEKAWSDSAKAAKKSYLAPISTYNAAVAAEEQENVQAAIDLYNSALAFGDSFAGSVKAQFSIGRLEESRGNNTAAVEAYRTLLGRWPTDPHWAKLAQSRLLVLSD